MTSLVSAVQNVPMNAVTSGSGVSLSDLVAQGIPADFITTLRQRNVKLSDIPGAYKRHLEIIEGPKTEPSVQEQIAALKAENERLKANKKATGSSLKVSEKGAVSVYGIGRFPVTLYVSQWEKLLGKGSEIIDFILANRSALATKE